MYRPKDWDNPHTFREGQEGTADGMATRALLEVAYEDGADAALMALLIEIGGNIREKPELLGIALAQDRSK